MNTSIQNLLADVNCSGSEKRVADCDHDGVGVVGVGCQRAFVTCRKNMSTTGKNNDCEHIESIAHDHQLAIRLKQQQTQILRSSLAV